MKINEETKRVSKSDQVFTFEELEESVKLAEEAGVPNDKILRNINNINNFFMS